VDEFPDNSYEARRAKKVSQAADMQPSISGKAEDIEPSKLRGKVVRKKKTIGDRFRQVFTGEDIRSVGSSLWYDTIVPALQDAVEDALRDGISRVIRGGSADDSRRDRRGGYRPNSPYTSRHNYQQYSSPRRDERTRPPAGRRSRSRDALDYREIVFSDRADADDILFRMEEKISRVGSVSIAQLYHFLDADEDDIDYTDEERGWFSARGFNVAKDRNGYRLVFPRPEHLIS
jgi:hypothetical protein